jgi:hypothetical protein
MRGSWLSAVVLLGAMAAGAAGLGTPTDDAYLDNLQGSWLMEGTLGGKPVHYRADGQRVLKGGFLRLHMIDVDNFRGL